MRLRQSVNVKLINVTTEGLHSALASINFCQTIEQVENALIVAQAELTEIITYKGYIKNASDKADGFVTTLSDINEKLSNLQNLLNTKFQGLDEKINGAINTINQIKTNSESILATAVNKNDLQLKLDSINSAIEQVKLDVIQYIEDNVLTDIENYATATNNAIATLNTTISSLESVLGGKVDAVKQVVDNIQPLTQADADEQFSGGLKINAGETKTFEERLEDAEVVVKQGYETIRETLLSYKKVNARISKKAVSFRTGRKLLCKMTIVGKTLRVYLALNPNSYEVSKFFQRDVSDVKAYQDVPMLMRVRSGRAIKRVVNLITDLEKANQLVKKS